MQPRVLETALLHAVGDVSRSSHDGVCRQSCVGVHDGDLGVGLDHPKSRDFRVSALDMHIGEAALEMVERIWVIPLRAAISGSSASGRPGKWLGRDVLSNRTSVRGAYPGYPAGRRRLRSHAFLNHLGCGCVEAGESHRVFRGLRGLQGSERRIRCFDGQLGLPYSWRSCLETV